MRANYLEIIGVASAAVVLFGCAGADPGASADESGAAQGGGNHEAFVRASAANAPGSLDSSFGTGGKVTTLVNPSGPLRVAVQKDGKIVVVTTLSDQFGVVRYMPNGSLDSTFGNGGIVQTSLTNGFDIPASVAIDSAGNIVVVGSVSDPTNASSIIGIVRYQPNGVPDPSFGNGGIVTTSLLGFRDDANVVIVQPADGKILVGGSALTCFGRNCRTDTAMVRYETNGSPDATFGNNGQMITPGNGPVNALAIAPDGSMLALDDNALSSGSSSAVTRFGQSGAAAPPAPLRGFLPAIATSGPAIFQPDGRVILGRGAHGAGRFGINVFTVRFTLSDTADPSWSSPAFAFDQPIPNRQNLVEAVLVDPSGRVLVGGIAPMASPPDAFGLARLTSSGALDTTFGNGGKVTTQFSTNPNDESQLTSLALQPDGKIVAAGQSRVDDTGDTGISLARYFGD